MCHYPYCPKYWGGCHTGCFIRKWALTTHPPFRSATISFAVDIDAGDIVGTDEELELLAGDHWSNL
jgi:hypothetical protein